MLAINANCTDIIVDIIQELLDFKAGSRAFFVQFRLQMTLSFKKEHLRPQHDLVSSVLAFVMFWHTFRTRNLLSIPEGISVLVILISWSSVTLVGLEMIQQEFTFIEQKYGKNGVASPGWEVQWLEQ